jgi:hypothetical protein
MKPIVSRLTVAEAGEIGDINAVILREFFGVI